jgi:hypothetical protein
MTMEEILQDPKTSWEEIRLALKSEGHATNGGVMMALVNATEALSTCHEEHNIIAPHGVKTTTKPEDNDHNEGFLHHSPSDEMLSNSDRSFGYKPCNTRKPAKNNPRRGFSSHAAVSRATVNSSYNSKNTSHSVNSSIASVDMMDFGVDYDTVAYSMETLNEIESRRGTQCTITNDDDESSCPTNGFLDWNHDDESSAHLSQQGGTEECNPKKQDIHTDDHEGAAGSEHRQGRRESWHIEDYDFEPQRQHPDPVIPKMLKRLSSGTVDTVSTLLSKLTHELGQGSILHDDRCDPQEATTDEVKKALSFSRAKYHLEHRRASC